MAAGRLTVASRLRIAFSREQHEGALPMKPHFAMMAAYNAWCNERLYDAAAQLSDADYRADRGAFFRSLHGTLNHLLATDRIWMKRFTGEGDAPDRLDAMAFEKLADLRSARQAEDERIVAFVDGLSQERLHGPVSYRGLSNPNLVTQPLASALMHVFNHQTHHRGQAHCILTGLGAEAPAFDLVLFQRQTGMGMA
jgi:uncharacterized damage-inducible protein DinB